MSPRTELASRGRAASGVRVSRRPRSSGTPRASRASRSPGLSGPAPTAGIGPLGRGDLPASLVIIFPLFLCYQLAIVVVPSVVATDPISRLLYSLCGGRTGYLLSQAALAFGFLWWLHRSGRRRTLSLPVIAPVVLESVAIAAVLWLLLPLLVHDVFGLQIGVDRSVDRSVDRILGTSIASALGAGLYEELTFRLLITGGAFYVALAMGLGRREAAVLAVLAGALAFAAAHHLGAAGEPFSPAAFGFRALAGLALGATCWFRSFAHAVYAHAAYDLLVLVA
jgi:Type II CAAX prenyl endopeptidase Rce1-like